LDASNGEHKSLWGIIPISPYSAGTGLPAGTAPVRGGIVVKGPAFDDDIEGWIHAAVRGEVGTARRSAGRPDDDEGVTHPAGAA